MERSVGGASSDQLSGSRLDLGATLAIAADIGAPNPPGIMSLPSHSAPLRGNRLGLSAMNAAPDRNRHPVADLLTPPPRRTDAKVT
jgi:hypothetical protein